MSVHSRIEFEFRNVGFEPGEVLPELLGGVCRTIPNTLAYFRPNEKLQALFWIGTLDQNLV